MSSKRLRSSLRRVPGAGRAPALFDRRQTLSAFAATIAAACVNGNATEQLTIYSPAPPSTVLHALNAHLLEALGSGYRIPAVGMIPLALPESINSISQMSERGHRLPIVTTVDFKLARAGAGPAWHRYDRVNADLTFVAKLYDVGFGVQTIDPAIAAPDDLLGKRIGAPPRPSAVRLLTESLLHDGWNILDAVTVVDLRPDQAVSALANGDVDAVTWNLVTPANSGYFPMLNAQGGARFLPVSEDALARINAASTFALDLISVMPGAPPLLSFSQALAAWESTDTRLVSALLRCIAQYGRNYDGLPDTVSDMARWPALTAAETHPAARAFYYANGITLPNR